MAVKRTWVELVEAAAPGCLHQVAWSTVCELLVASLPPKDALPTLSSVYLVCELYVSNCMTMSHVLSKQHGTRWTSTHLTNREGLMSEHTVL